MRSNRIRPAGACFVILISASFPSCCFNHLSLTTCSSSTISISTLLLLPKSELPHHPPDPRPSLRDHKRDVPSHVHRLPQIRSQLRDARSSARPHPAVVSSLGRLIHVLAESK